MPKTFYIIDGHAQIYRAYFAPFRDQTSPTPKCPNNKSTSAKPRHFVRRYRKRLRINALRQ